MQFELLNWLAGKFKRLVQAFQVSLNPALAGQEEPTTELKSIGGKEVRLAQFCQVAKQLVAELISKRGKLSGSPPNDPWFTILFMEVHPYHVSRKFSTEDVSRAGKFCKDEQSRHDLFMDTTPEESKIGKDHPELESPLLSKEEHPSHALVQLFTAGRMMLVFHLNKLEHSAVNAIIDVLSTLPPDKS
jgi:hypothetical protein